MLVLGQGDKHDMIKMESIEYLKRRVGVPSLANSSSYSEQYNQNIPILK